MSDSPYLGLAPQAYWRTGFAEAAYPPPQIFRPRWPLTVKDRIVTAGSCFAQHVGRALKRHGFNVLDAEPRPDGVAPGQAQARGYDLYSARYGNIYTTRQLRQLLEEAWGGAPAFDSIWEKDGRYYDALRPGIEPEGFASAAEVAAERARHLACVRQLFTGCDVFIFTLGLTEAWCHKATGQVYATAPGTIAGRFDDKLHAFVNFRVTEVRADLEAALAIITKHNPALRVLLTVSPVPLTATASGVHVLQASTLSKSVLRAVAGEMAADFPNVDYFPSYELVTSAKGGAAYFEPNLRTVRAASVATIMETFVSSYGAAAVAPVEAAGEGKRDKKDRAEAKLRKERRRAKDGQSGA